MVNVASTLPDAEIPRRSTHAHRHRHAWRDLAMRACVQVARVFEVEVGIAEEAETRAATRR